MKRYLVKLAGLSVVLAAVAATSTLYQDEKQQYVSRDASQSATDIISTISCILFNTGVDLELAAGGTLAPYGAHINEDTCRAGVVSTDADQAGSVNISPYWIVPSKDADGVVRIDWYEYGERPTFGQAVITKGKDSTNPYGVWKANACAEFLSSEMSGKSGADACSVRLYAEITENNNYHLYYKREASGTTAPLNRNYVKYSSGYIASDLTSGYGNFYEKLGVNDPSQGFYGFKDEALLVDSNGSESCKLPTNTGTGVLRSVWDAWLYDPTTKERVNVTDGPRDVTRVADKETGRVTHEGVRLNGSSSTETSGQFKLTGDTSGAIYTARGTFGKLVKKTPEVLAGGLSDIDMVSLRMKLRKANFSSWLTNNSNTAEQYTLGYWSATKGKFVFTHTDNSTTGLVGKSFTPLATPQEYTPAQLLSAMQSNNRTWERRIWTYLIGSNFEYVIQLADPGNPATLRNNIEVIRLTQKTVVPGSADAPQGQLACLGRCLVNDGSGNEVEMRVDGNGDVPYFLSSNDFTAAEKYAYGTDGSLKTATSNLNVSYLKSDGETGIDRNGIDTTRADLYLGDFFEASAANIAKLNCTSGNTSGYCSYDTSTRENTSNGQTFGVLGLSHYYSWNTGPERWNKFAGLVDSSGNYLSISDPLTVFFNVPNDSATYGDYAGQKITMRYPGAGQLWLPGRCVNSTNNALATSSSCNQTNEVWIHDIVIPTDEQVGRVTDASGSEYLVKWLRQGVLYPNQDSTVCSSNADVQANFQLGRNVTLPTADSWTNPREIIGPNFPADASPENPKYNMRILQ
jgi:hypothetical protein